MSKKKDTVRKAVLLENPHPRAAQLLRAAGVEVELVPGSLAEDDLIEALQGAQILGIRSKTEVTAPTWKSSARSALGRNRSLLRRPLSVASPFLTPLTRTRVPSLSWRSVRSLP